MKTDATPSAEILLVDDREEDLLALTSVLAAPGIELVAVRSGSEALKQILERDFALILLDVRMPTMDGFELASIIKQRARSRHTPILFLTAAGSDVGSIYRGYSAGAVDVLGKPVDPDILRAKVATFVDLFRKDQRIKSQAAALREADRRERELQLTALRLAARTRYNNLAEAIPQIVWTATPAGELDYCNHRFSALTGIPQQKLLGDGWLGALHPEELERCSAGWREAVAGGQHFGTECRLRCGDDGSYRWFLCEAVPERDAAGQIVGWLGTYTDCDDLKRVQSLAEAATGRFQFLADASVLLSSSLDPRQSLRGVAQLAVAQLAEWCLVDLSAADGSLAQPPLFVHADPALETHLAGLLHDRPQALGEARALLSVVTDESLAEFCPEPAAQALLRELRPASLVRVPLVQRELRLGAIVLGSGASGRHFDERDLVMVEDLARRIAMTIENSKLYDEARQAIAARDEFLSVAAHELRTPLTTLFLQLESLHQAPLRGAAKGVEIATNKLELCIRQTGRLERLINSLLDVSRIATGHLELTLEELDIAQVVRDLARSLGDEAARAGCQLEIHADVAAVGRWDRLRLEQVVTNLFSNALRYASGSPIEISVENADDRTRLSVRDHGIGIAAADLQRIFQRFERAVPTRHYGGLGMGLYITRQIVEAHGGSIQVASELGQGSTFTVELPPARTVTPAEA